MVRKGLGAALLTLLLLSTACRPTVTPEPTSPLPTPSPTSPPPTATPTPAPGSLVDTLTLWVPEDLSPYGEAPGAALLAQQLDGFNQAHTDLQVAVVVKKAHGRGGLLDFLRTAAAAGVETVLPDLMVLGLDDMRVATQEGLLQPLDGLFAESLSLDLFPFAVSLGQVDEQTMGIPMTAELEHLAYQPTLFDSPPLTWTDVFSSPAPYVFPAAGQEDGVNDVTLAQYLNAGGRLTNGEGVPQLEAEPLAAVLGFYEQAIAAKVLSPTVILPLTNTNGCWDLLLEGQAGMAVVDSRRFWAESTSVAPGIVPTEDGEAIALARGEWALVLVATDPQRQQQAMVLAEWLMTPEWHGPWAQSWGYLPTTRSGLTAWTVSEEERAVLEAMLEHAQLSPPPAVREVVGPALQTALEAVLRGRRNPTEAAADAVRAVGP